MTSAVSEAIDDFIRAERQAKFLERDARLWGITFVGPHGMRIDPAYVETLWAWTQPEDFHEARLESMARMGFLVYG